MNRPDFFRRSDSEIGAQKAWQHRSHHNWKENARCPTLGAFWGSKGTVGRSTGQTIVTPIEKTYLRLGLNLLLDGDLLNGGGIRGSLDGGGGDLSGSGLLVRAGILQSSSVVLSSSLALVLVGTV